MILVVSYPGDEHTAAVTGKLRGAGREVVEIDLADFPARAGLVMGFADGPPSAVVETARGRYDLAACAAGWWRRGPPVCVRPRGPGPPQQGVPPGRTPPGGDGP